MKFRILSPEKKRGITAKGNSLCPKDSPCNGYLEIE